MKNYILIFMFLLSSCAQFNPSNNEASKITKRLEQLEESQKKSQTERTQLLLLVEEKNKILENKMSNLQQFSETQGKINEQILMQLQNQNKLLGNFDNKIEDVKFTHYQVLVNHADKIYRQKKYQQALFLYDRLLVHKKSMDIEELRLATYRQALINFRFKNYDTSLNQFFELVNKQGKSRYVPSALYHAGIIWYRKGKYEKAAASFKEVINKHNYNKRFYNNAKKALNLIEKRLKNRTSNSKDTDDLS